MKGFKVLREVSASFFNGLTVLLSNGETLSFSFLTYEVDSGISCNGEFYIKSDDFGEIAWIEKYNSHIWVDHSKEMPTVKLIDIKEILEITFDDDLDSKNDEIDGYSLKILKREEDMLVTYTLDKESQQKPIPLTLSELIKKLNEKELGIVTNLAKELVELKEG